MQHLLFSITKNISVPIYHDCHVIHTYIHTLYEIYNALHSRVWLESEARAVARWQGLGRNGREVECF